MLSPYMLKSTSLIRKQTLSPDRNKKKNEEKFRRNRSGSVMVFVEDNGDDDVINNGNILMQGRRNSGTPNLLQVRNDHRRSPSPSPAGFPGKSYSHSPRNSISVFSYMDTTSKDNAQIIKDAKFQRRKTSTAVSLMKKLKITSNSEKEGCKIEVHHYSNDPTIAWEMLKVKQPVKVVKPMALNTPVKSDCVRFVCMSDTHGSKLNSIFVPDGDVLLVAGNFTHSGHPSEVKAFNQFLGTLPHRYKVVIAGNHELTFDSTWQPTTSVFGGLEKLFKGPIGDRASFIRGVLQTALAQEHVSDARDLMTNCIYLEDESVNIYGLRIYGTPWVPLYDNLAFNLPRGQKLLDKWNLIPAGVDVLLTQTPPLGYGDLCHDGHRAGCVELLTSIRRRIHPKYHVFGHIMESYGCTTDGYTKFINASIVNTRGRPVNQPVLFDITLPHGETKE